MRNLNCTLVLLCLSTAFLGCKRPAQEPPIWEQVKIGDLASAQSPKQDMPVLNALKIDVHVYSVPAHNIEQLRDLWEPLQLKGMRYTDQQAFRDNGFRTARARITVWDTLAQALARIQAQKVRTISFMLSQDEDNDLPLAGLHRPQDITFTGLDGSEERILIGPGIIAWRLKVERIPSNPKESKFTAYPVFKLAGVKPMRYQTRLIESSQIAFLTAAFSVRMGYGDLIVLGPEESLGDASTLGGKFFGIPNYVFLGLNKNEPVKSCPAVRVFVLTCSGIQ
jgi:hypothetical protein